MVSVRCCGAENNHPEAFHQIPSKTFRVAHTKLPVLINILQKADAEKTPLRQDANWRVLASRSQKQVAFERGMKTAFEWYRREASERRSVEDDYAPEVLSRVTSLGSTWNTTTRFSSRESRNGKLCLTVKETRW